MGHVTNLVIALNLSDTLKSFSHFSKEARHCTVLKTKSLTNRRSMLVMSSIGVSNLSPPPALPTHEESNHLFIWV